MKTKITTREFTTILLKATQIGKRKVSDELKVGDPNFPRFYKVQISLTGNPRRPAVSPKLKISDRMDLFLEKFVKEI